MAERDLQFKRVMWLLPVASTWIFIPHTAAFWEGRKELSFSDCKNKLAVHLKVLHADLKAEIGTGWEARNAVDEIRKVEIATFAWDTHAMRTRHGLNGANGGYKEWYRVMVLNVAINRCKRGFCSR